MNNTDKINKPTTDDAPKTPTTPSAKRFLWLLPLVVFMALVILMYLRLGDDTQIIPEQSLNRAVPTFSLPSLMQLERQITQADLPQSPYVLNIWGSWCPSCRVEHPLFMRLAQNGVNFVGINYKDERGDALGYLNSLGNPYSMIVQDATGTLVVDLGLTGAPESFVVDAAGHIRQHIVGVVDEQIWQARMQPCLSLLTELGTRAADAAQQDAITSVCR